MVAVLGSLGSKLMMCTAQANKAGDPPAVQLHLVGPIRQEILLPVGGIMCTLQMFFYLFAMYCKC